MIDIIKNMLRLHRECCSIDDYINKETSIARTLLYEDCIKFIKKHNLWKDEKYLMEALDDSFKLKIAKTRLHIQNMFRTLKLSGISQ